MKRVVSEREIFLKKKKYYVTLTVSFNGLSHFRTCHITRKSDSSWKGHLKNR